MKRIRISFATSVLAGGLVVASAMLPITAATAAADAPPDGASGMPPGPHDWGPHGDHHRGPGHWGPGMMYRRLGLTDTQKASVKSIMEQNRSALHSLHQQSHANSMKLWNTEPNDPNYASVVASVSQANAGLLTQEITLQANIRAQLFEVLTPAQQSQLAAMQAKMQSRMAEHASQGAPAP
jgi:Spy/CpxP family protein refolding chaperone